MNIENVYLKLLVNVKYGDFKDDGSQHENSFLFTYKINNDGMTSLDQIIEMDLSNNDLSEISENLLLNGSTFDGSQIDGCKLEGNHYTCQAWNDVIITGTLQATNGYTVDIFAGHEIYELPESTVAPEIVREIKAVIINSHPMTEVDDTYTESFCAGGDTKYLGNTTLNKPILNSSAIKKRSQSEFMQELFDFTLSPNPSQNRTSIHTNQASQEVKIKLHDVSGKEVSVLFENSSALNYSFDVSNLEKGIYFVTVISGFEQITKQLMVQ